MFLIIFESLQSCYLYRLHLNIAPIIPRGAERRLMIIFHLRHITQSDRYLHYFILMPWSQVNSFCIFTPNITVVFCTAKVIWYSKFHGERLFWGVLLLFFLLVCHTVLNCSLTQRAMLGGPSRYLDHVRKVHRHFCRDLWKESFISKNKIFSE